jgi:DNA polymerase-3 subunit delta
VARDARPGPVQAIVGEDTYLAEEALERILAQALGEDRADSLQVLYGDEARWEQVLAAARTGSLFASRRAIVVRRADMFAEDRAKKADDEQAEDAAEALRGPGRRKSEPREHPLIEYLANPTPDVTLILVAGRPDRRRKPWARLPKGVIHDASPKKGRALRAYVEEELRSRALRLGPDGVSELVDRVGQDLRRLMGEVDKLEAFAADGTSLSAADVAAVLGRGFARPLYLLGDAVAARDLPTSLELIDELMGEGEEGLRILATVHRSLRQVRAARAMRDARRSREEIGSRLLPPSMQFKLDAVLEASRRWSEAGLRRAFGALGRADRRLKRGAEAETTLLAALMEGCGTGESARPSPARPGR